MNEPSQCYHCGLALQGTIYYVTVAEQQQPMCCLGCQAVAQTIVDSGLESYYQYREQDALSQQNKIPPQLADVIPYDQQAIIKNYIITDNLPANINKIIVAIDGITCAACVWLLEKQVNKIDGVQQFVINLTTHRAMLVWDSSITTLSHILFTK